MPMKIKEAAAYLGCHPNTLRNLEAQGLIKPYRLGKRQDRYYSLWMLERLKQGLGLQGNPSNEADPLRNNKSPYT